MTSYSRGEVVLVDLGTLAKVRPCVVLSVANADKQRNMSVVAPMTTQIRHGECEVTFPKPPWLKQPSVVNLLGIAGVDNARITRKLGQFPQGNMVELATKLGRMLGLS